MTPVDEERLERIRGNANYAIEILSEARGEPVDYDLESIKWVEGFIERARSESDRREVLLVVTAAGEEVLRALSALHKQQLRSVGPAMVSALSRIVETPRPRAAKRREDEDTASE